MSVANCPSCEKLPARYDLRTPEALTSAIGLARGAVASGAIRDISPSHGPSGDFAKLSDHAPWPEFVEHYFQCNSCQRAFRLSADTLNNVEGEWEPYVPRRSIVAPVNSWRQWYVELGITAALIAALHFGFSVLPSVVALILMGAVFVLVARGMIWSWREFRRENRF